MKCGKFLLLNLLAILLLLATSCSDAPTLPAQPEAVEVATAVPAPTKADAVEPVAPTPAAPEPASPGPTEPVVLRVGTTRQIKSTNILSDYWFGVLSSLTTHDSLISMDSDLAFTPGLADRWEASDDGNLWKFYINPNAKWHDGQPVTPEDVRFNLEYRMENDPQSGWMKGVIDTVEVDGDAVVLRLSKPYGTLLIEFNTYRVLPKHIWQDVEEPLKYAGDDVAVGCGPFVLDQFDLNAGLLAYRANPDYYRGSPSVDRVEFHIFRNVDAMTMALSKGEVDVTWDYTASMPYTSVPALMKADGVRFASEIDLAVPIALGFNLDRYPMDESAFREAISYAISYDQISEFVFAGYGTVPTAAFVPPVWPFHDPSIRKLELDREKAAELLDSLGLRDTNGDGFRETPQGERLRPTPLSRTDSAVITRSGEMLQGDLRAIGIDVTLKALDSATWVALKDEKDYDLVLFRTTPWGMMMHAGYGSGYFDVRRTGAGVLHNVDDPALLELVDTLLRTTDQERVKELILQLQAYYATELPGIALAWAENVYPYREGWEDWRLNLVWGGLVNRESFFAIKRSGS